MLKGWKTDTVGDLCERVSVGIVIKPSQYYVDDLKGIRTFRSLNVGEGKILNKDWIYISEEGHQKNAKSRLQRGDVLVVRTGAPGTACVLTADYEDSNCIDIVFARPKQSEILPDYLAALTNSVVGRRHVNGNLSGLAQKHFNVGAYKELVVDYPPLPEQRKIVEILRTWDEAIEKLEALHRAKRRRFDGAAQRLFAASRAIGRDRIPTNWSHSTFGDVFTERQDKNNGLKSDDVVTVGKYAIRKQSEHFTRSVASKDLSKYWVISPGDFVYDPMSAYYGAVGLFTGPSDGIVSPAYRVIRMSDAVEPDFMVHLLKTHHIRFLLETRSSQGNKEGKRRLLQRDEFEGIEFFLPPIEEQRKIAETLSHFLSDLAKTDELLAKLTRQKRGLMQKLLTGEWPVDVGNSEASEASK